MINYDEYQRYKNELDHNPHLTQDIYRQLSHLVRDYESCNSRNDGLNKYSGMVDGRSMYPNFPTINPFKVEVPPSLRNDGIKSQITSPNKLLLLL